MLPGGLAGLRLTVHPPPAADDPLDMVSGAGAAHREQPLLGLGRGHARQGPNLGVGELAAGEGLGQQGQRAQRARHSHVLAGRTGGESHPPAQPRGARAEACVPAIAGVELADEVEEAGDRGVEVRRQLGDFVAQLVQGARFHNQSPLFWGDFTPEFRTRLRAARTRDHRAPRVFS